MGGALALLLLATGLTWWLLPGWIRARAHAEIEARLSQRLDRPVRVLAVDLGLDAVELHGVCMLGDDRPELCVEHVRVGISREALWDRRIEVTSLEARGGFVRGTRATFEAELARWRDREAAATPSGGSGDEGRVRVRVDAVRWSGVSLAVHDGARWLRAQADVHVVGAPRRADIVLRELRADVGGGRTLAADRMATVLTAGDDTPIAFPLVVEVEGLGTAITPRIAVAGVAGTITAHDRELRELSVELAGGFAGGGELTSAPQLWSVGGRFARDLSAGRLSIDMEAFELGRVPSVLQQLPLEDSEDATIGGHVTLELGPDLVRVDGSLDVDGLHVRHPTLARDTVHDVGFSIDLVAEVQPRARRLRIPSATVRRDDVVLDLSADVVHPEEGHSRRWRGQVQMRPATCQAVLDAIPIELVPALAGFRLEGDFTFRAALDVDFARLEDLVLEGDVGIAGCRVEHAPPAADAARLAAGFEHRVTMRDGRVRTVSLRYGSGGFVPVGSISPHMIAAVLTTEDGGFYRHHGFLPSQFRTALERNLREGRVRLGASTITMQMIKNVWLSHERTLSRKLQELFLTWYVETALSKDRILEIYLNIVELGPGIYGVGRGARHYFGKSASELTPPEAAWLALMLPSPVRRHAHYCRGELSEAYRIKVDRIVRLMWERGRLDDLTYETYREVPLVFDTTERGDPKACLGEIAHLMAASEGQRALSGLLTPPDDVVVVEEPEPEETIVIDDEDPAEPTSGEPDLDEDDGGHPHAGLPPPPRDVDPAQVDAPGRPAMDDEPEPEPEPEPTEDDA